LGGSGDLTDVAEPHTSPATRSYPLRSLLEGGKRSGCWKAEYRRKSLSRSCRHDGPVGTVVYEAKEIVENVQLDAEPT
jgi:hypothetical protein